MKKFYLLILFVIGTCLISCNHKDSIWTQATGDLDARVTNLEKICSQMNTNISSLQTIVSSVEAGDYITNITPIIEEGDTIGYTITFAKNGSITIYNGEDGQDGADGKDGQDGQNGADGKDGVDGTTPIIGVAKDTDNIYYWTLNGTWLLDVNGQKIRVTGADGQNGTNGNDGVSPKLKIENDYWYISYDNGATWTQLSKSKGDTGATGAAGKDGMDGKDGVDGKDGDSMFSSVTYDDSNMYFTLTNGTVITISKHQSGATTGIDDNGNIIFADYRVKMLCVAHWDIDGDMEISVSEANQVESLDNVFVNDKDIFSFNELQYFTNLAKVTGEFTGCKNLCQITLPASVVELGRNSFSSCSSLRKVVIPNNLHITSIGASAFAYCSQLDSVLISNEVRTIGDSAFIECSNLHKITFESLSKLKVIGAYAFCKSGLDSICIPASVTTINVAAFNKCAVSRITFETGSQCSTIAAGTANYDMSYRGGLSGVSTYSLLDISKITSCTGVFAQCSNLTYAEIPPLVQSLPSCAFMACTSLTDISFTGVSTCAIIDGDGSISSGGGGWMPAGAFAYCVKLKNIVLPSTISKLAKSAFYGCTCLESVVFSYPSSISALNSGQCSHSGTCCRCGSFSYCTSLKRIRFCTSTPPVIYGNYVFLGDTKSNISIEVPEGASTVYSTNWSGFKEIIEYYQ